MAASTWVNSAPSTPHQVQKTYVNIGTTPTFLKQIWANVSGTWKLVFAALQPFTQDFTTPGAFSTTVPFGAVQLVIASTGGGAGGGFGGGNTVGAGGTAQRTIPIAQADWGASITFTVGAGGAGNGSNPGGLAGAHSAWGIVVAAGSFTLTGNGGTNNSGGTASGGTTNTTGGVGSAGAGRGGDSLWALGGVNDPATPGNGTLGSGGGKLVGVITGTTGGNGGDGRVKMDWS